MSFYIRMVGNELFYGGYKGVKSSFTKLPDAPGIRVILPNSKLVQSKRVWVIGEVQAANYVAGRLLHTGLYVQSEVLDLAKRHRVVIIVQGDDDFTHYTDKGINQFVFEDEYYDYYYGCTKSQVDDIIDYDITPTNYVTYNVTLDI